MTKTHKNDEKSDEKCLKSARKVPFFILWPEFPCFRPAFQARVSGPCFRPVFQARVLGPRFRPASWATAVHCKSSPKSDLNTFEARLVYTSICIFGKTLSMSWSQDWNRKRLWMHVILIFGERSLFLGKLRRSQKRPPRATKMIFFTKIIFFLGFTP